MEQRLLLTVRPLTRADAYKYGTGMDACIDACRPRLRPNKTLEVSGAVDAVCHDISQTAKSATQRHRARDCRLDSYIPSSAAGGDLQQWISRQEYILYVAEPQQRPWVLLYCYLQPFVRGACSYESMYGRRGPIAKCSYE